jgi:hypothetical protein
MCDGAAADNCPVFSAPEDFLLKNKSCNINNPQEVTQWYFDAFGFLTVAVKKFKA